MVIKAKKGLSRKELQNMCKLYGLPANKSHSHLENSLLAFLQEGINSSICDLHKASHTTSIKESHRKAQRKSSVEKCFSFAKQDAVELRCDTNSGDIDDQTCPPHNTIAPQSETCAKLCSPPFQFYVRSEDGLNLCVDLNSSPSDWGTKFQGEVHIAENVEYDESWSLHDDLECLKEMSSFKNITCSEEDKFDQSEEGEKTLDPNSNKSKENQLSSCLDCDSPHHRINVSARTNNKPIDNTAGDSIPIYAVSNLSRCHNNTTLHNGSCLPKPSMVQLGCSVSSSIEMQSSEVASCNKDTSGSHCENAELGKYNKESEKSGVGDANSSQLNHIHVSVEPGERSNSLNERETSECSEFIKPSEKDKLDNTKHQSRQFQGDELNSNGGHQKKRKRVESESGYQSSQFQANVKILRSMKRNKNLPRRSMRLLSK